MSYCSGFSWAAKLHNHFLTPTLQKNKVCWTEINIGGPWWCLVAFPDEVPWPLLSLYGHMPPKDNLRLLCLANFPLFLSEGTFVLDQREPRLNVKCNFCHVQHKWLKGCSIKHSQYLLFSKGQFVPLNVCLVNKKKTIIVCFSALYFSFTELQNSPISLSLHKPVSPSDKDLMYSRIFIRPLTIRDKHCSKRESV